ncbi:MAG: hypothetical protein WCW52_11905 [Elusimicrobiales bacterium]|jgi:hypothetical protein
MPEIRIGDIARNRTSGAFGVVVDIEPPKNAVIAVHGPEEVHRIKSVNAELFAPPALNKDFKYGQFAKDRFPGMMVAVRGDKYLALAPDGKCYPKGRKYESGDWYKLSEIKEVTKEEKEEFLFKLSVRHTEEEYAARYEATKAGWRAAGLAPEVKRFEVFFDRILSLIGGKAGVNWGARLSTVFAPDPTLNLAKDLRKDLQARMFCFFSLGLDARTGKKNLSVFIKEWKWIPEAARAYFPREGDGRFYPPGHCTALALDVLDDAALLLCADSLAKIYLAADK